MPKPMYFAQCANVKSPRFGENCTVVEQTGPWRVNVRWDRDFIKDSVWSFNLKFRVRDRSTAYTGQVHSGQLAQSLKPLYKGNRVLLLFRLLRIKTLAAIRAFRRAKALSRNANGDIVAVFQNDTRQWE